MAKDQNRGLEILEAYQLIALNYEEQNLFKEQSFYLMKYIQVNDSIRNELQSDLFSEIVKMETDILDHQHKTRKLILFILVIFIILLVSLGFLVYRLLYQKKKKIHKIIQTKDLEVKTLQTKLENQDVVD